MKYWLTNTLKKKSGEVVQRREVRLTIDTDHEMAMKILQAAMELHANRPDPILEALKAQYR